MHFENMISTFYKDHPEKPKVISPSINSAPTITKSTAKRMAKLINVRKRERGQLAKTFVK